MAQRLACVFFRGTCPQGGRKDSSLSCGHRVICEVETILRPKESVSGRIEDAVDEAQRT